MNGVSEAQFQSALIEMAHVLGWKCVHFRPALNGSGNWRTPVAADGGGWVDLVLVRDRVIFAELKSVRGKMSPEQVAWKDSLEAAGAEYYLWRIDAWKDGTIERVLRKRAIGCA